MIEVCKRCSNMGTDCKCTAGFEERSVDMFFNNGKAMIKLDNLLSDALFEDLSKHNPFWNAKDDEDSEKLHMCRVHLTMIEQVLYEIYDLLKPPKD